MRSLSAFVGTVILTATTVSIFHSSFIYRSKITLHQITQKKFFTKKMNRLDIVQH